MYERSGIIEEYNKLKPNLTPRQVSLLCAFNRLSQERRSENGCPLQIKDRDIHYYQSCKGSHGYAPDMFEIAIHDIDNEHIKQRIEEITRKNKDG